MYVPPLAGRINYDRSDKSNVFCVACDGHFRDLL